MLPEHSPVPCLTEEEVLSFVLDRNEGTLPRDLTQHLDACTRCQTLVAEGTRAYLSGRASSAPGLPRTLANGEVVLGRYQVQRFIGAGGMGEVYEALDRDLGEVIALKTVTLTTLDDQRSVARLKAEVQLARRITHPNVCRIFDFAVYQRPGPGAEAEAIPILTMELLAGETLSSALHRRGRLTTAEAQPILEQILAGLGAVHAAEIVHRDLKAENVFLVQRPDGGEPRVVLMDFGLARPALLSGASNSFRHTLIGTASYMAPEQVEGRPVSFASDVYAAGVLIFEMVTGRLPFDGDSPMTVAFRRLQEPPPRPSSLVPDLDPRWEAVILRCLARTPADRYQSAGEMVAALRTPSQELAAAPPPRRRTSWPVRAALYALPAAAAAVIALRLLTPPPPAAIPPVPPPAPAPAVTAAAPPIATPPPEPVKPAAVAPVVSPVRHHRPPARRPPTEVLAGVHPAEPDAAPAALPPPPPPPTAEPVKTRPVPPDETVNPFHKP